MSEKKWVKIEGTKVGADGTGYFRGINGRYYYGNLKNGYLRETNQSRAARERRAAAQRNHSPDLLDDIDDSLSTFSEWEPITFGDIFALLFMSAAVAFFAVAIVIFMVFYGITFIWPTYIGSIVRNFARGTVDPPLVLMAASVVFLLAYFLFCSYTVFSKKSPRTKQYLVVGTIGATILLAMIRVLSGNVSMGEIFEALFVSVALSALPALVLCFFGHLVTKEQRGDQRWFITRVAKLISPVFIGHSTGLIIFGAIVAVVGLGLSALPKSDVDVQHICVAFMAMGVLFLAMGIIDKVRK